MATFILFWNPAISSWTLDRHRNLFVDEFERADMNWSIWEHAKAHEGDTYVMVRCKNKPVPGKVNQYGKQVWEPFTDATTGICMVGTFSSEPYQGEDWSGKGRVTYYADLDIDFLTDPEKNLILSTDELMAAIPDFDWKGGHSGRKLDDASAEKLHAMLQKAVEEKKDKIWSPDIKVFID